MFQNVILDLENSNATPFDQINSKEFVEGVLKCGSLISMLENKKINTTMLFSLIVENKDYQQFFVEITASESLREALLALLHLHPSLVKSKITKSVVRKISNANIKKAKQLKNL